MTDRPTNPTDTERLARRLAALEAEREYVRRFSGFARCYPAFAIVLAALTFLPLYDRLVHKDTGFSWSFGSIWQIIGDDNSGAGLLGLMLFGSLATMLTSATFARSASVPLLVACAVIALILVAMILLKPAMPDPPPDVGYGGEAAIGVLILLAACTSTHAWLLVRPQSPR